jgi:D-arabinose 1-dehydrogenase-like Zn-dependent alcohol dehydrogenase
MQKHLGSFDFILDAVAADHDINAYVQLLPRDGNIALVGAPILPLRQPDRKNNDSSQPALNFSVL